MSEDIHILQRVSDYQDGIMLPEERNLFEAQIASQPALAALIESEILARETVIGFEALKLKDQIKRDLTKPKSKNWYWIGLSLVAILSGGIYWQYISSFDKKGIPVEILKRSAAKRNNRSAANTAVTIKAELSDKLSVPVKALNKKLLPNQTKQEEPLSIPAIPTQTAEKKEAQSVISETFKKDSTEINLCLNLNLTTRYTIIPSCSDESTGELNIRKESIKSGLPPYSFSLDGKEFRANQFSFLQNGTYILHVKDANNCISKQEVVIPSVQCGQAREFSYNPVYDPAWIIPYNQNKKAKMFRITDKGGQDVYRIAVSDGNPAEWHGESNTGMAVSVGYHLFFIEYTEGTIDKGAIIILQ